MTHEEAVREAQRRGRRPVVARVCRCDGCGGELSFLEASCAVYTSPTEHRFDHWPTRYAVPGQYHSGCAGAALEDFTMLVASLNWCPSFPPGFWG